MLTPEGPGAPDPATSDRIEIRGLRSMGVHGLLESEHLSAQPFEVDLDLYCDLRAAAISDAVADTVDYAQVCHATSKVLEGPHLNTLEALAGTVADAVLAEASGCAWAVSVTIRKLRPPVPFDVQTAAVRIWRTVGD